MYHLSPAALKRDFSLDSRMLPGTLWIWFVLAYIQIFNILLLEDKDIQVFLWISPAVIQAHILLSHQSIT